MGWGNISRRSCQSYASSVEGYIIILMALLKQELCLFLFIFVYISKYSIYAMLWTMKVNNVKEMRSFFLFVLLIPWSFNPKNLPLFSQQSYLSRHMWSMGFEVLALSRMFGRCKEDLPAGWVSILLT